MLVEEITVKGVNPHNIFVTSVLVSVGYLIDKGTQINGNGSLFFGKITAHSSVLASLAHVLEIKNI